MFLNKKIADFIIMTRLLLKKTDKFHSNMSTNEVENPLDLKSSENHVQDLPHSSIPVDRHYLNLEKNPTVEDVKKEYLRQLKNWHPDHNSDPSAKYHFAQLQSEYKRVVQNIQLQDKCRSSFNATRYTSSKPKFTSTALGRFTVMTTIALSIMHYFIVTSRLKRENAMEEAIRETRHRSDELKAELLFKDREIAMMQSLCDEKELNQPKKGEKWQMGLWARRQISSFADRFGIV
eukprot:GHVL01008348.1.p1 GENE.GHVL01008348.1~~GHVL01008348.1.p1  ORF type:complete len:234 (+),score=30.53 GHVL01008348.1:399-1100(+)